MVGDWNRVAVGTGKSIYAAFMSGRQPQTRWGVHIGLASRAYVHTLLAAFAHAWRPALNSVL